MSYCVLIQPASLVFRRSLLSASIAVACFGVSNTAVADNLPDIVITASRQQTKADDVVADVTVISRQDIERATGRTLLELLSRQPGIQFTANGGAGKVSGLFIRGLETRHTLVLIDGVRYGSATTGSPPLENIPLDNIERIEIVRGPMSGLYGSDAVAGVVQIFTRQEQGAGVKQNASVTVGSNQTSQFNGGVSYVEGPLSANIFLQHAETAGFSASNERVPFGSFNSDRDGFRQNSANAHFGYKFSRDWRADVNLLRSYGNSQFDDGPTVDSRAKLSSEVSALQLSGKINSVWNTVVRASQSRDANDTIASTFGTGEFATTQQQLAWENTIATPVGSLLLLAEHLKQGVSKAGQPFDVTSRIINGLGVGLNGRAGNVVWQGNVRRDNNSQFGGNATGAVGLGYFITPAWRIGASYGESFVAPSFNQLYFPRFGNPNLQPEEGKQYELNARYSDGPNQFKVALFEQRIRGFITSGPSPVNIPRSQANGVSVSYDRQFNQWVLGLAADHVDPKNDTDGVANSGKQLPRRAKNSLKANADWQSGPWSAGGTFNAFSRRFEDAANTMPLGGYGTLDLRADWRYSAQWSVGVRANNVSDKQYETALGYNQPRREYFLTLRYTGL